MIKPRLTVILLSIWAEPKNISQHPKTSLFSAGYRTPDTPRSECVYSVYIHFAGIYTSYIYEKNHCRLYSVEGCPLLGWKSRSEGLIISIILWGFPRPLAILSLDSYWNLWSFESIIWLVYDTHYVHLLKRSRDGHSFLFLFVLV